MPIHTSSVSYHSELGCIHFLKQVLLPVRFRCTHNEFTHIALVHSAVIRKRNCAILGDWLPGVCYLRGKNGAPFGAKILSAVRNREVSASRRLLMYYRYSYGIFNP